MTEPGPPQNGGYENQRTERPISAYAEPAEKLKPKTSPGMFVLGFVTPFVVWWLSVLVSNMWDSSGTSVWVGQLVAFSAMIASLVVGSRNDMPKLRSFGLGSLSAYIVAILIGLLAFGTCLIGLGNQ